MTLLERWQHFLEHLRNPEYVRGVLQPYSGVELSRRLTNMLLTLLPPATEGDSHAPK